MSHILRKSEHYVNANHLGGVLIMSWWRVWSKGIDRVPRGGGTSICVSQLAVTRTVGRIVKTEKPAVSVQVLILNV